jgi:hypothetical protein
MLPISAARRASEAFAIQVKGGSKVMKVWLRILGGAYIVVGGLNSFLFLFILGAYGGKWGVEAIRVEEYVPLVGHLGGWVLYVLLGCAAASILAGIGLLRLSAWSGRLALLLSVGNLVILPFGTIIGCLTILTLLSAQGRAILVGRYQSARLAQRKL